MFCRGLQSVPEISLDLSLMAHAGLKSGHERAAARKLQESLKRP